MSTASFSRADFHPVPEWAEEPLWLKHLTGHAEAMRPHDELPDGLNALMAWREQWISRLTTPGEAWGLALDEKTFATADCEVATESCDAATAGCDTTTAGCDTTTESCDAATAGCDTTTESCDAATAGCDTTTESCDAATEGCDAATAGCDGVKPCGQLSTAAHFQALQPRRIAPWLFGRAA